MALELPNKRITPRQIEVRKRNVPLEQIIAVQGYNPLAAGIETAGNAVGAALLKRAQLRREGELLAQKQQEAKQMLALKHQYDLELQDAKVKAGVGSGAPKPEPPETFTIAGSDQNGNIIQVGSKSGAVRVVPVPGGKLFPKTDPNPMKAARDLDTYVDTSAKALQAIEKIRTASQKLPEFKPGLVSQASGKLSMAVKSFAKDPSVAYYEGVVSQELIPLARSLAEEKGPITDLDVARIEKGLGDKTTPLATRRDLLNQLVNKIELGLQTKAQTANIPVESLLQRNPSLGALLSQQKALQLNPIQQPAQYSDPDKEQRYQQWKKANGY